MYFEVQSFVTVETSSENGANYMYRTHPEPSTTEEVGLVNRLVICLHDNTPYMYFNVHMYLWCFLPECFEHATQCLPICF